MLHVDHTFYLHSLIYIWFLHAGVWGCFKFLQQISSSVEGTSHQKSSGENAESIQWMAIFHRGGSEVSYIHGSNSYLVPWIHYSELTNDYQSTAPTLR